MTVRISLLPEDERTFRFENIARSTKFRQGRGDIRMRGDADIIEVVQKGKIWYILDLLVQVIHVYDDAITASIIPHVSSQGNQSFALSSLPF